MQTNRWKKDDHRFDSYIQQLQKRGLQVHPGLKPAIFTLNNGLEYPGLRIEGKVAGPDNLVTVPTSLLLTAHKARQQPALSQVFTHAFYNTGEDRILITYLLYINHQKDESNVWYHMVRVFSKQVDVLSFWNETQIEKFSDKSLKRAAELERSNFEREWVEFEGVKEEHEDFFRNFPQEAFGRQNYEWIYTHAVSRCFGSFMNSTYFTPFCQFFNHHCVDVSYQCVTQQEHSAHLQKNQQHKASLQDKNQQEDDSKSQVSSASSGNSVDYIEEGDFNYWQIESYKIKWGGKVSFDLKDKETIHVQNLHQQCIHLLEKTIVWGGHNYVFMGQVIEKLNIIKNEYMAGRKKFPAAKEAFEHTKSLIQNYRLQALTFYRTMGYKYNPKSQKQTIDNLPSTNTSTQHQGQTSYYQNKSSPPAKDYKYFLMQAQSKVQFEQNEQVYFRYGHISNRTMLIRYGCCIEDNAYEYVWFRLPVGKALSPYPDLFEKVQEKGLPIYDKLKLKGNVWIFELYLWLKLLKWELARNSLLQIFYPHNIDQEIDIFQTMISMIKSKIPQFTAYQNYQDLTDPSISYHEYFTRVYHKEKVKILEKQLLIMDFVLERLNQMNQAKRIVPAKQFKEAKFKKELRGYWKILQKGMITF